MIHISIYKKPKHQKGQVANKGSVAQKGRNKWQEKTYDKYNHELRLIAYRQFLVPFVNSKRRDVSGQFQLGKP